MIDSTLKRKLAGCAILGGVAIFLSMLSHNSVESLDKTWWAKRKISTSAPKTPVDSISTQDLPQRLADFSFERENFANPNERAEFLLNAYRTSYRGLGEEARSILDAIQAIGLAPSVKNAKSVRAALAETSQYQERVALIRILGTMYDGIDENSEKQVLIDSLRELCNDKSDDVARSAILTYARLGFFSDTLQLLNDAKTSARIDDTEYHTELAYLFALAPSETQKDIAEQLLRGNSSLSRDIVASALGKFSYAAGLEKAAAERIYSMLTMNEPVFSGGPHEFGLSDAIRYGEWVSGVGNLYEALTGESKSKFVTEQILNSSVDPRKPIAALYLMSPEERMSLGLTPSAASEVLNRVNSFVATNEKNVTAQEAASASTAFLRGVK